MFHSGQGPCEERKDAAANISASVGVRGPLQATLAPSQLASRNLEGKQGKQGEQGTRPAWRAWYGWLDGCTIVCSCTRRPEGRPWENKPSIIHPRKREWPSVRVYSQTPYLTFMVPWLSKSSRARLVGWHCLCLRIRCTGTSEALTHSFHIPRTSHGHGVVTCQFVARMDEKRRSFSYGQVGEILVGNSLDRGSEVQVLDRQAVSIRLSGVGVGAGCSTNEVCMHHPQCQRLAQSIHVPCFQYIGVRT